RSGGLFETTEKTEEAAFVEAIRVINDDNNLLSDTVLEAQSHEVPEYDSFQVGRQVCELLSGGVAAVFGPRSSDTWDHVQSICDTMEMPHVGFRWDDKQRRGSCLLNLYPHPSVLATAFADIVSAWSWKRFTVIYDVDNGLKRINELLKLADYKGFLVTVRQLDDPDNYRNVLRKIKSSGEKNIVIECSSLILYDVLIQAQQVGLMGSDMSYIITSLDFQTMDLEPFKWGGTNITGVRLVDPDNPKVKTAIDQWQTHVDEENKNHSLYQVNIYVNAALIYDAVFLFANALHNLETSLELNTKSLDCDAHNSWEHGYSIINYMKMSELHGLSGMVRFDHQGFRTDVELSIVELVENGLVKKGIWNSSVGVNMTFESPPEVLIPEGEDLRNVTFIVLIALTHPYGMLKKASQKLSGNDRYEGFGIDLIHELSLLSGFNYTFHVQADKSSGNPDKVTGKWNGMIGEVLAGRADLAIADITITRERERDADFTMPFMNLGISVLHRKPTKQAPSLFSFLSPFSYEVWAYMMSAYVGVSLLLFIMGRISPYEWRNPYPCIEEPETLENQFSLANSLWFTMGSLMQQGSDVAPISVSTRMVAAVWWFFILIMVSSYTANLAAFLTIELTNPAFRNVEDLANQKVIKMWKFMEENPDVMMPSNEAGVDRVINEVNYAFLMESTSIENALSTNVVKLQEKGKLTQLKNKWWKEKRGGGACTESEAAEASELDLENVGGVFLVMMVGLIFSVFVAVAEALWHICTNEEKASFKEELIEEIKFITKCHGTTKPVRKYKSDSTEEINHFDSTYNVFEDKEPLD
ncbi:hypothetical protein AAG570_011365, partial [Ranatra chinensis]